MAAILDSTELEIAPFDPPIPKTLEPNMTWIGSPIVEIWPSEYLIEPEIMPFDPPTPKNLPKTKHDADRMTGCHMAIQNSTYQTYHKGCI